MPELPEVRAQAGRLAEQFGGTALARFDPLSFTILKTAVPDPNTAVGAVLESVTARGKVLLLGFGPTTFAVHLMQGGRLEPDPKQAAKPRGGQARWKFDDGSALLFSEYGREHKAGVWVTDDDPSLLAPLADLGPDADTVSAEELHGLMRTASMRLHGFLRDQHQVAGLGRRLANEVCFRARLSPFASTAKLTADQVAAVHQAIADSIADSLAYEATQDHMTKSAERPALVHHRTGQPCGQCGDQIRAVEYNAYVVNYCPTCQTGGKLLADNTTSKFLK